MSTAIVETPPDKSAMAGKRKPTVLELYQYRINILTNALAATEGRTDLRARQKAKRNKQIQEKVELEAKFRMLQDSISQLVVHKTPSSASLMTLGTRAPHAVPRDEIPLATQLLQGSSTRTTIINAPSQNRKENQLLATAQSFVSGRPSGPAFGAPLPIRTYVRDRIVTPSAASGGIPEPSQAYISYSSLEPQMAAQPQPILLVIDLNGTLLFRPDRDRPRHFVERPATQQFLNYVLNNYSVMVWSSAQPMNVEPMCNKLFPGDSRQRLLGVWARDRLGLTPEDSLKRVQVYKRLERVWRDQEIQSRHPLANQGGCWHQGNTVLLDDSVEKSRSEPYNFVEIIEFTGAEEDPNILRDVAMYLAILRMQRNVSSYIRYYPLRILKNTSFATPS